MDNQHKLIKGYRDLSEAEIECMNCIKAMSTSVGEMVALLRTQEGLDQRWVSIAATDLQKGFMSLVRAVAQPETF